MTIESLRDAEMSVHERATYQWVEAVRVYRSSPDLYHQAMNMRLQRAALPMLSPRRTSVVSSSPRTMSAAKTGSPLDELTAREREVACLIATGYTNQQIAEMLVLTRGTVANHVAHILYKLGVSNRTQVAALVHRHSSTG